MTFVASETDPLVKICSRCGLRIRTPFPADRCHHVCPEAPDAAPPLPLDFNPCCNKSLKELWSDFRQAWKAFFAAGHPLRDATAVAEALDVCRTCSAYSHPRIRRLERCTDCGCFLQIKARMATEHCPRGLWPVDPPQPEPDCPTCG